MSIQRYLHTDFIAVLFTGAKKGEVYQLVNGYRNCVNPHNGIIFIIKKEY